MIMAKSLIRSSWDEKSIEELETIQINMKSLKNKQIIERYINVRRRQMLILTKNPKLETASVVV